MWKPDFTRRDKTNLYLVPPEKYDEQESLSRAMFPQAKIIDWRGEFLDGLRPTQKRLGLSVNGEIRRLAKIGNSDKRVFSIINTEYLLAHFDENMREQFWVALRSSFPHPEGIIIFTILASKNLMPDKLTLASWLKAGRLFNAMELQTQIYTAEPG